MTRYPIAHDAAAGPEISALFADLDTNLRLLLAGAAGCSPYLKGIMLKDAGWLRDMLSGAPEAGIIAATQALDVLAGDALAPALRKAKRRIALTVALADLGGIWPLETVTGVLTDFADHAVALGLKALIADEIRRGKLPGAEAADAATGAGMVVLAMGKMGAGELNYSSDIDLICLFDETRYPGCEQEARASFIREIGRAHV